MSVQIKKFTFNAFQENTFLVHSDTVGVIIDPGCYERTEQQNLFDTIESLGIEIKAVLLTHAHIDHVLGARAVTEKYNLPLTLHEIEVDTLNAVPSYAAIYGFPAYSEPAENYVLLQGGETLEYDDIRMDVFFTPGHSVGHVVYYMPSIHTVINGDVLFQGSFGRVDLPGGDIEVLKKSIFNVMFNLPEETIICCGHGPETTVGREKQTNFIHQF